ncbi:Lrp/AsnC family transcriptional regulator [Meiothermus ruber]|jgi:Lrp/AsnC family leucine-responsive transcriptional regulator|uniref:AsnC family transcriptional regulator n=1 Tax=Meiothermus ruber (strain ATCC 35948 / DSM 1279 / VKM B-1258 / 21) TaxID=504728 RepID=D3PSH3_MEIRD|nr:Lrp/AsnC family transcriptional regulator [Meiothermus ruber]ADD28406.1 transcriptional regulator, AsnC family [Meiothermus ruber DSM 1279]AGK06153.1 AsnC family transcriptional regulator [Meiothermus ruber DSM 1279]MCL6528989.1 Lrp/AsnC family transcriptional regulator [Meiothermus ruber]GAO75363.1 AsnC family transcriptional regulator [Meiothermus ruber H328]
MAIESKPLDEVSWKILELLQQNARLPYSELGRQVGLSAPAVAERVRRMEEAGIIRGYRADVDPSQLGYTLEVFIRAEVTHSHHEAAIRYISQLPNVLEFWNLTGRDGYLIRAVFRSVQELEQVLNQKLGIYGTTTTALVLSKPVAFRVLSQAQAIQ